MESSQRSESTNSFFDGYVNSNTPLSIYIDPYEKEITGTTTKTPLDNTDQTTHGEKSVVWN